MDNLKRAAGEAAMDYIVSGMSLGIGSGTTAEAFISVLGLAVADGLDIVGVPTSVRSERLCRELSIPLSDLSATPRLDLTIDGTDELDSSLNLIKGGGGALLREKIVAASSSRMLVIADSSKLVSVLGSYPLPIEIESFGYPSTLERISSLIPMESLSLRRLSSGDLFTTDGGHYIVDASFGEIPDPIGLERSLNCLSGVIENGLFTKLASIGLISGCDGIKTIEL